MAASIHDLDGYLAALRARHKEDLLHEWVPDEDVVGAGEEEFPGDRETIPAALAAAGRKSEALMFLQTARADSPGPRFGAFG